MIVGKTHIATDDGAGRRGSTMNEDVRNHRSPEYRCDDIFPNRWSPRAMSGEEIEHDELMSLFEAARWAPSAFNAQPWRFVYARRDTGYWNILFDLLVEANQVWARNAAALVVIVSDGLFEHNGKPNGTHALDTGAAWQSLALQGSLKGLVVHGMAGFDHQRAREVLGIPARFHVQAMAAIGRRGRVEELPEKLREREVPSDRRPVAETVFEGRMS
jgi:nitroreductase